MWASWTSVCISLHPSESQSSQDDSMLFITLAALKKKFFLAVCSQCFLSTPCPSEQLSPCTCWSKPTLTFSLRCCWNQLNVRQTECHDCKACLVPSHLRLPPPPPPPPLCVFMCASVFGCHQGQCWEPIRWECDILAAVARACLPANPYGCSTN